MFSEQLFGIISSPRIAAMIWSVPGTGSSPHGQLGRQRITRLIASLRPRTEPCFFMHSIAYLEQLGLNRHAPPRWGERCCWYPFNMKINNERMSHLSLTPVTKILLLPITETHSRRRLLKANFALTICTLRTSAIALAACSAADSPSSKDNT